MATTDEPSDASPLPPQALTGSAESTSEEAKTEEGNADRSLNSTTIKSSTAENVDSSAIDANLQPDAKFGIPEVTGDDDGTGAAVEVGPPATLASWSKKALESPIQLTRQNLTAIPHAVADGFWYTKDVVSEESTIMMHKSAELLSVRNWRCITVSASMTCVFYLLLITIIPVIILLIVLLTYRKYVEGETLVNITKIEPP